MQIGVDMHCGAVFKENGVQLELSDLELKKLDDLGIPYIIEVDDLTTYYKQRAEKDLPDAKRELKLNQAKNKNKPSKGGLTQKSVSSTVLDNFLQYTGSDEIDWATPSNFNLGSMGGCLTLSEMKTELDDMRTYSVNNSLNIVSVKQDASSTGKTTWGNPASSITNNGQTYSGQGTTRWDPETIWYVRITGNESGTPENTKPQMLFTSMIHSREVSALMNNIYFMWYLIENYNTDDAVKELVDNNELYFVPVVNPDGLRWNEHLSSSGGGLQRKNLRPNTGGTTNTSNNRGVDLNRNFDYFWGYNNIGSSGTTTSGTYRGPSPESEPETQIMVDFITSRNFKSGVWNHSYANSVPHPYGGIPTQSTGREDEYYRWHEEMTRYNRYLYGATIFYESNGLPDDWMMGGAPDNNGSTGSGQAIIATTPEHGGQGFWPTPSTIDPIAKQSMRISLGTIYYGGKYAKLHDLTQSNVTALTSNLDFGIERVGQTASDFTVTVTPISSNITTIVSPTTETGMSVLEQRTVTAQLVLNGGITANEKIEYNVKLSNDDGIIYEANYEKYYQPTVIFSHNPDTDGLTGWTQSGGWNSTTVDAYSGSNALSTGTYSNNATKTLTTTNNYDFSSSSEVLIQFYSKWDIERNYDFVEVLGSPDGGSSWISLGGNYTKPNATSSTTSHDNKSASYANFQANSQGQVYDGDRMDNWVMEEIAIDPTNYTSLLNSSTVKIRFNFRTDALNVNENYTTTSDGFFIDDFKILSIQIPCDNTNPPTNLVVSTITTVTATVDWDNIPSATYDIRYKEISSGTWTEVTDIATNSYNISGLTASTDYEVQVRTRCTSATSLYSSSTNFTTATPVPCTGSSVSVFPYSESFESGIGLWSQGVNATDDDIDWTVNSGTTTSTATGPNNASDGTQYIYTETSTNVTPPGSPSKLAYLISPCFEFNTYENSQLSFDYHMYGADIGTLNVEVSIDNGANYANVFSLSGQQQGSNAAAWVTQIVDLSAYDGQTIKIRFNALTGASFNGDIAVDNINITADAISATTWYQDFDSDGFGNPSVSQVAASQPVGYVADNTDCDDTDANINPNTVWYLGVDSDGDGFFGSQLTAT
ncbi:M14 family zinc carboxypeptidase, partial [Flaviramulus multivorans]